MPITIIVATDRARGIGIENRLPWRLPEDLAHFKRTTTGHPIIMGRRTFDSIGRALPGRRNIVVTRNANWQADGAERASSLDQALALCIEDADAFVIGGAQLFIDAVSRADCAIVTEIACDIDGDTFFPPLDAHDWIETSREQHVASGPDALPFAFVHYARRERSSIA